MVRQSENLKAYKERLEREKDTHDPRLVAIVVAIFAVAILASGEGVWMLIGLSLLFSWASIDLARRFARKAAVLWGSLILSVSLTVALATILVQTFTWPMDAEQSFLGCWLVAALLLMVWGACNAFVRARAHSALEGEEETEEEGEDPPPEPHRGRHFLRLLIGVFLLLSAGLGGRWLAGFDDPGEWWEARDQLELLVTVLGLFFSGAYVLSSRGRAYFDGDVSKRPTRSRREFWRAPGG